MRCELTRARRIPASIVRRDWGERSRGRVLRRGMAPSRRTSRRSAGVARSPMPLLDRREGPPRRCLLLEGHTDVVTEGDATLDVAPLRGELRDGRIYGRGAADMKRARRAMVTLAPSTGGRHAAGKLVVGASSTRGGMIGVRTRRDARGRELDAPSSASRKRTSSASSSAGWSWARIGPGPHGPCACRGGRHPITRWGRPEGRPALERQLRKLCQKSATQPRR